MSKNLCDVSAGEKDVKQPDEKTTPDNNSLPKRHKRDYAELKKKFFGDDCSSSDNPR